MIGNTVDRRQQPSRYGVCAATVNATVNPLRRRSVLAGALAAVAGLVAAGRGRRVSAADRPVRIAAFGDSLMSGYGLPEAEAFPAQLEATLRAQGLAVEVLNAAVSGDTTAGGRARLGWVLADAPDAVVLCLGANDGLRGIDPANTRANLEAILDRLAGVGIPVLLAGMLAPPNLGRDYGDRFNRIFPALSQVYGVPLYPFFLSGVAAQRHLNQRDGIHPNADGVAVIVDGLTPHLARLIREHGLGARS